MRTPVVAPLHLLVGYAVLGGAAGPVPVHPPRGGSGEPPGYDDDVRGGRADWGGPSTRM